MALVDGLGLLDGLNVDEAAVAAFVFEFNLAGNEREQGVVFALADVCACLMPGAALANDDGSGVDELAAKALDAEALTV